MPRSKAKQDAIRFSVSLDHQLHSRLIRIAEINDVSLAWTVRKAIAEFVKRHEEVEQAELPFLPPRSRE